MTADTVQKKSYPVCGFTYDLALTACEPFSEPPEQIATAAEVETSKNYLTYILGPGQAALPGHDFLGLPTGNKGSEALAIAQAGLVKSDTPDKEEAALPGR